MIREFREEIERLRKLVESQTSNVGGPSINLDSMLNMNMMNMNMNYDNMNSNNSSNNNIQLVEKIVYQKEYISIDGNNSEEFIQKHKV
jgi:hypothetical protein